MPSTYAYIIMVQSKVRTVYFSLVKWDLKKLNDNSIFLLCVGHMMGQPNPFKAIFGGNLRLSCNSSDITVRACQSLAISRK
jgi:hypothetical protein